MAGFQFVKNWEADWRKLRLPKEYYDDFLRSKGDDKLVIGVIDLMYVRNFKKGENSIGRISLEKLEAECRTVSHEVQEIGDRFGDKAVSDLTEPDFTELQKMVIGFCCDRDEIPGFSLARRAALLHCLFPSLIAMVDRWVVCSIRGRPLGENEKLTCRDYRMVLKRAWETVGKEDSEISSVEQFDCHHWCEGQKKAAAAKKN